MGAWGHGSFDNDDALEWVELLQESAETLSIESVLSGITERGQGYLEVPECSMAIAAAEVVAAMVDRDTSGLPAEVAGWIMGAAALDPALIKRARKAVVAIGRFSELKQLWEENEGDYPKWIAALASLESRLKKGAGQ